MDNHQWVLMTTMPKNAQILLNNNYEWEILKEMIFGTLEYHHHHIPASMVGFFWIMHKNITIYFLGLYNHFLGHNWVFSSMAYAKESSMGHCHWASPSVDGIDGIMYGTH